MDPLKFKIAHVYPPEKFEESLRFEASVEFGLLNFIIKAMQFSYDYYYAGSEASELLPNGTWTGLTGLLNRSEVDIAVAPFLLSGDGMSFNYPHACDDITFIGNKPSFNPEVMAIFQTLSVSVWLSLLIAILMIAIAFFVVFRPRYTMDDVMLHVLAIGLNQEGIIISKRAAEILLLSAWMLSMALFTACFKSVLLCFLSFPPLTGVRNVPELAAAIRAGKYSAMSQGRCLPIYLQGSSVEDIRIIGENSLKNPSASNEDVLKKIPNVVFTILRSSAKFVEEMLFVSKDSMGFLLKASAVRKDFCCKDEINMIIHRFLAAGIDLKIRRFEEFKFATKYFSDFMEDNDKEKKISLRDVSGAFILLIAGYCLSAFVLLIELRMKNREREIRLFSKTV